MRIILVTFVLVGGTAFFGYWSIGQFSQVFDNFSLANTQNIANTQFAYSSLKRDVPDIEIASTTPDISVIVSTSTDLKLASISREMTSDVATLITPELSFNFPQSDTKVYMGCTYEIPWESSTTVDSLEVSLIDADTGIAVSPNTSGFAKENIIEEYSENLNWKVGVVWAGEYFILISKINGIDKEIKSKYFTIYNRPESISANERKNICK